MPRLRPYLLSTAVVAVALVIPIAASGPTFWTVATASEFLKGKSDGVYVSLTGELTPGPVLTNRLTTTPAQVWSLARTADGTIWAGTGGEGHVLRLRPGQPEESVFDAPEPNVFAMTASGSRVFAATSPDGKVYVIDGNAPARVFFDPKETYIWALAVDSDGRLWVGAGNPAVIYRVAADGTSEVVYRPPAAQVVALALDSQGRMLAGTESPGRLYRFDEHDRPFALLDTGLAELSAISTTANGTVFAAAIAKTDQTSAGGEATSVAVTLASSSSDGDSNGSSDSSPPAPRAELYRIAPDGTWEDIWSTTDLIYDLSAQPDGSVLAATGPDGRLYKIGSDLAVSLYTGVDAHQITRFAPTDSGGRLTAFATANPGRVVAVGSGAQSPATFVSDVHDTNSVATWGLVRWEATGAVSLSTRSGNTDSPDDSWSDWTGPYTQASGQLVTSPAARYIQWRAVLTRPSSGPDPALTAVTLAYLPRNSRPEVVSITVHPPGVVFQRPFVNDESAIAGLDDETAESRRPPGDTTPTPAPGRRRFQKGLQTIAWKANDEDGDRLTFSLQYRREGESQWRDLKSGLQDSIFVWDTTTVADGRYIVRVLASDDPSNAEDRALVGVRESDPITIDNTPPHMTVERTREDDHVRLDVHVVDARSPLQKVEYSVGGGPWQLVYPVDGLSDSPDERYQIRLDRGVDPSDVVIRATDLLQNVISQPAVPR